MTSRRKDLVLADFVRELRYAVETKTNITLEPWAAQLLLKLLGHAA